MSAQTALLHNVVSGIWKFSSNVSVDQLVALAEEWRKADTENRYSDLHVRGCSNNQFGIGFKYGFKEETHKPFFHRMTDQLKRRFGNDLVGWDIYSPTWIVFQKEFTNQ